MKRFITTLIAGVIAATPLIAAPILWRDIEVGASEGSVREKYPPSKNVGHFNDRVVIGKVPVATECSAYADIKFAAGLVKRVKLSGEGEPCSASVLEGLNKKYGQPTAIPDQSSAKPSPNTIIAEWVQDGVSVSFKATSTRLILRKVTQWEVRYTPEGGAAESNL